MGAERGYAAALPDDHRAGVVMYPQEIFFPGQQVFLRRKKLPPVFAGLVASVAKMAATVLTGEHIPSSFHSPESGFPAGYSIALPVWGICHFQVKRG